MWSRCAWRVGRRRRDVQRIKMFHHTGNLHRSVLGVRLLASPWIALFGFVQLALFGFLFVALLAASVPTVTSGSAEALEPRRISTHSPKGISDPSDPSAEFLEEIRGARHHEQQIQLLDSL